jgi:hypothetical protein
MKPLRAAVAVLVLALPLVAGEPDFDRVRERVLPGARERWEEIGWETDLLAARERAVRERRPLFLWAMNGHPLGCT